MKKVWPDTLSKKVNTAKTSRTLNENSRRPDQEEVYIETIPETRVIVCWPDFREGLGGLSCFGSPNGLGRPSLYLPSEALEANVLAAGRFVEPGNGNLLFEYNNPSYSSSPRLL